MPTYTCFAPSARLNAERKRDVAAAITRVHHEVTGAPAFYAQVMFVEVGPESLFIGAAPVEGDQLFVQGQIRAGRTTTQKQALITRLAAEVAVAAAVEPIAVWVYIVELPPSQMVEFGRVLPQPGAETEQQWLDEMPEAQRRRLLGIGRG